MSCRIVLFGLAAIVISSSAQAKTIAQLREAPAKFSTPYSKKSDDLELCVTSAVQHATGGGPSVLRRPGEVLIVGNVPSFMFNMGGPVSITSILDSGTIEQRGRTSGRLQRALQACVGH